MFLKFGQLESRSFQGAETSLPILLLGYEIGFQIWLLLDTVKEIVSRRDHKIRWISSEALLQFSCTHLIPSASKTQLAIIPFIRYLALRLGLGQSKGSAYQPEIPQCRCMDPVPLPNEDDQARCSFLEDWPLLAVVVDAGSQEEGAEISQQSLDLPVSQVKLYSLKRHTYIHTISIPGKQSTEVTLYK